MTCATSPDRRILATACKASLADHAKVILYDMRTMKRLGEPLEGHTLTITRIAFSHNGRYILTCSRDRTWRLFAAREADTPDGPSLAGFEPVAAAKPHARIIWDCAWAPDDGYFVTVSRDKQMKIWRRGADGGDAKWECAITQKLPEAGTAVAVVARPDSDG